MASNSRPIMTPSKGTYFARAENKANTGGMIEADGARARKARTVTPTKKSTGPIKSGL